MNNFNKKILVLVFLLIVSNVVWWFEYTSKKSDLVIAQRELSSIIQNKKILAFQKLFIEKVLMSSGVVDFNTRVLLQNAVTEIHDESISQTWDAFLSAKTESEGQSKVKELLLLLASRVYRE